MYSYSHLSLDHKIVKMHVLMTLIFCCFYGIYAAELDTEWWKHTTIYEMIVQVFKDSDGDGIGDIRGIISKLDHFVDLGIETLYCTPMYKSELLDMGYDIIDYREIDPRFGTMEDFEQLIKEMNSRGMKLIMDLVINHSSDKHEWFQKSIDKIDPYTDYYIWKDGIYDETTGTMEYPNEWISMFTPIAWTWNEKRKQFYYHMYLNEQVDLNFNNKKVREEVKDIITFWFDKGIAGFRMDAPMCYIEDKLFRNGYFEHQTNQKESFGVMHELAEHVYEYNLKHGGYERILAAESHATPNLAIDYYGRKDYRMVHFPFNFDFDYIMTEISAVQLDLIVNNWLSILRDESVPAWIASDHDTPRIGTRIRPEYKDIFTIVTAMLPGIFHIYYGTEIGMMNGIVKPEQYKDISGQGARDSNRLLMQWDDSLNGGFSSSKITFSPVAQDYYERNVKKQKTQKNSHYNLFKTLTTLRKSKTLKYGSFGSHICPPNVYIFWRFLSGEPLFITVVNFSYKPVKVKLKKTLEQLPKMITVVAASINSGFEIGSTVGQRDKYEVMMRPLSVLVFSTSGQHKFLKNTSKLGTSLDMFKFNATKILK